MSDANCGCDPKPDDGLTFCSNHLINAICIALFIGIAIGFTLGVMTP